MIIAKNAQRPMRLRAEIPDGEKENCRYDFCPLFQEGPFLSEGDIVSPLHHDSWVISLCLDLSWWAFYKS
jgi:hypothetical protein